VHIACTHQRMNIGLDSGRSALVGGAFDLAHQGKSAERDLPEVRLVGPLWCFSVCAHGLCIHQLSRVAVKEVSIEENLQKPTGTTVGGTNLHAPMHRSASPCDASTKG
jgi:hypothetical protein